MTPSEKISKDVIESLEARAEALESRTRRETTIHGHQVAGEGYRMMSILLGGILIGLALGVVIDEVAHTKPFGIIAGVLLGFAGSVTAAVRMAQKLSAEAEDRWGPPRDLPPDEDESDD